MATPQRSTDDPPQAIVVHTSWRGRLTSLVGPAVLLALGVYGIAVGGPNVVNVAFAAVGAALLAVGVFDYPFTTWFLSDRLERRCLGRTQTLDWGRVGAVRRASSRSLVRGGGAGRGGLVAVVGGRPHLLSDRAESQFEFEALRVASVRWPAMAFTASEPAAGRPPTWLHKRRPGDGLVDERGGGSRV
ncbi:MAG: hypothetical protein ACRBI6_17045 [Acidimicrobiales bacterium]